MKCNCLNLINYSIYISKSNVYSIQWFIYSNYGKLF